MASRGKGFSGAYLEGEVLDPLAASASLGLMNVMSVLHAVHLRCIRPHLDAGTVALEIGPGTGAWTKAMLEAKELWCLDLLDAGQTGALQYLGSPPHLRYLKAQGWGAELPDGHFNYMFSFGCLCHLKPEEIASYARGLFPKLKPGSHCYWMVADYDKLNQAFERLDHAKLLDLLLPRRALFAPLRFAAILAMRLGHKKKRLDKSEGQEPRPGRWYHTGTSAAAAILKEAGYRVLDWDVGVSPRDPILHFLRP